MLAKNGKVKLGEMLYTIDDVEEHATRDPSDIQKSNIEKFNTELDKKIADGKIVVPANATMYFVIDASRKGPGHGRGHSIHVDRVPTLTTVNRYLYLLRRGPDASKVPENGRFLDIKERAAVCGVKWTSVDGICSRNQHTVHFGNMVPVDMAGVVLAHMIMRKWAIFEKIGLSTGLKRISDNSDEPENKRKKWKTGTLVK